MSILDNILYTVLTLVTIIGSGFMGAYSFQGKKFKSFLLFLCVASSVACTGLLFTKAQVVPYFIPTDEVPELHIELMPLESDDA